MLEGKAEGSVDTEGAIVGLLEGETEGAEDTVGNRVGELVVGGWLGGAVGWAVVGLNEGEAVGGRVGKGVDGAAWEGGCVGSCADVIFKHKQRNMKRISLSRGDTSDRFFRQERRSR